MRKNKFLAALAIAACLATSVPFSVNAATPGQAKDASKVHYASVSVDNKAVLKKLFNAEYYKAQNPDLVAAGITTEDALFNHFVTFGVFEGRACCDGFNVAAYKSAYKDLQAAFGDDIVAYYVHFQNFGKAEKRALITVEAATAAGVTVVSAADGTTVAAAAAPAASATSTAASTTETASEEDLVADFADGVKYDAASDKFYSTKDTKASEEKLGVLAGYVYVGGKYYSYQTVSGTEKVNYTKADAYTYDKEKYVEGKDNAGKDAYGDLSKQVAYSDAYDYGVDTKVYVNVSGKYYQIANVFQAYTQPAGTVLLDKDGKPAAKTDAVYCASTTKSDNFTFKVDDKYCRADNGSFYAVISKEVVEIGGQKYFVDSNKKAVSVSGNTVNAELVKVGGKEVAVDSTSRKTTAKEAAEANMLILTAGEGAINLAAEDLKASKSVGYEVYDLVDITKAGEFSDKTFGKSGSTYYYLKPEYTEAQAKDNSIPSLKDGLVTSSKGIFEKADASVYHLSDEFGTATVDNQTVYYKKVAIGEATATGTIYVAPEGYVCLDKTYGSEGKVSYKEVAFDKAFKAKEGYKVVKKTDKDGKVGFYYVK